MSTEPPLVLVTGVSGFIGSWVGYATLKQGYRVRGTVRSLSNTVKVKHLQDLCPGSAYKIELVEADLTSESGWDEAVKDVDYVLHVASPAPLTPPKDENDLIKPAVDGTLFVLNAIKRRSKLPKRVVITSSFAAIGYGRDFENVVFNDDIWTVLNDPKFPVDSYVKSKTLAEKAAWKFVQELPEDKKFELCTINPSFVLGPPLASSDSGSIDAFKQILLAEIPAIPNVFVGYVSLFDVVRAHLLAMKIPEAAGKRFLLSAGRVSMPEASDIIAKVYKPLGYKPTTMRMSKWAVQVLALFSLKAKRMLGFIDKPKSFNPANARDILGIKFDENISELITITLHGAIQSGIILDKTKDKSITGSFVRPDIDLTGIPSAL